MPDRDEARDAARRAARKPGPDAWEAGGAGRWHARHGLRKYQLRSTASGRGRRSETEQRSTPGYRIRRAVQCWRLAGCVRGEISTRPPVEATGPRGSFLGPSGAIRLPRPVRMLSYAKRISATAIEGAPCTSAAGNAHLTDPFSCKQAVQSHKTGAQFGHFNGFCVSFLGDLRRLRAARLRPVGSLRITAQRLRHRWPFQDCCCAHNGVLMR